MRFQFVKFVFVGGIAAAVNFLARILFDNQFSYVVSIVLAYFVGMFSAFLLFKFFVFEKSCQTLYKSAFYFVLINLFGLLQTIIFSLLFKDYVLPMIGFTIYLEELAHIIGLGIPIITSFFGHKYLSFAKDKAH